MVRFLRMGDRTRPNYKVRDDWLVDPIDYLALDTKPHTRRGEKQVLLAHC
jgi:hypothetical protein